MARPGPRPTPTAVLQARGSWRSKSRKDEPTPPQGDMTAPPWLSDDAREHWQSIEPMLRGLGLASPAFSFALALLCNSLSRYVALERQIGETGITTTTASGSIVPHPAWHARNQAINQTLSLLKEHGLTPAALTGMRTTWSTDDDTTRGDDSARSAALRLIQ